VGALIGPVISVLSFVCSIGKRATGGGAVERGISFGGVVAFIFADLIIIPILLIYRKYYGTKLTLVVLGTSTPPWSSPPTSSSSRSVRSG
jgi:hypothetical protein